MTTNDDGVHGNLARIAATRNDRDPDPTPVRTGPFDAAVETGGKDKPHVCGFNPCEHKVFEDEQAARRDKLAGR